MTLKTSYESALVLHNINLVLKIRWTKHGSN